MFNQKWFKDNQKILLRLLNNPLTKRWFRYVLRIYCKEVINQITPNSYTFGGKLVLDNGKLKAQFKTDFRSYNKYSKRFHNSFLLLWSLFHIWDILVANKLNKSWNLGFDSTFYTATGGTGVGTDVSVYYSNDNTAWATLRNSASGTVDEGSGTISVMYQSGSVSNWKRIDRFIACFDTSPISEQGTITGATFSIYGQGKGNQLTGNSPTLNVYGATPGSVNTFAGTDYAQIGTTALCDTAITYAGFSTTGYNDFSFNATGLAAISTTGYSKFGVREATYDVSNSEPPDKTPPDGQDFFSFYTADAGSGFEPKLLVNWAVYVTPSNATIVLSGQAPTIVATITVSSSNATIVLSSQVPTITKTGGFDYPDKNITTWTFISKS